GFIGFRPLISNIENFAVRILSVGTIERCKCTELIPAGIQLLPLFNLLFIQVFPRTDKAFLRTAETIFRGEATDIKCPVGHSGQTHADTRRDLLFHIAPAGDDVATPDGRTGTLDATESGAGQDE